MRFYAKNSGKPFLFAALIFWLISLLEQGHAQGPSNADLAKEASNPVADLISLPLQNNTNFNMGPYNRTQNVLNIQPVVPFHLNSEWNLITRTIAPVIYQPELTDHDNGTFGLGDINATLFLSPAKPGKLMWGMGPVFSFPTATDEVLGTEKWGAGISGVVLTMPGNWVIGGLFNNIWSYAGNEDRNDMNRFLFQYFLVYNIPKSNGWYMVSSPIITADWEEESENRWTIPFGGGVGKILRIGKLPVNLQLQGFYNAETPEWGPDWSLRFQIQFLFPK